MLGKVKLTPELIVSLREEAKAMRDSELWEFMRKELEYVAFVRGRKSITDEDNLATHYMFYNLDIMENFLENIINPKAH